MYPIHYFDTFRKSNCNFSILLPILLPSLLLHWVHTFQEVFSHPFVKLGNFWLKLSKVLPFKSNISKNYCHISYGWPTRAIFSKVTSKTMCQSPAWLLHKLFFLCYKSSDFTAFLGSPWDIFVPYQRCLWFHMIPNMANFVGYVSLDWQMQSMKIKNRQEDLITNGKCYIKDFLIASLNVLIRDKWKFVVFPLGVLPKISLLFEPQLL